MTFEVVRAIQGREKKGVVVGVVIASGFESEADAIEYASLKDYEYVYRPHREKQYPFTYYTTRESNDLTDCNTI